ncbi:MAG: ribonuclease Z [Zavarzinella sp.]
MLDVALVGTGGTLPLPQRYLASALIRYQGELILIDCGEGTQVSLRELGWGLRNIGVILITHFHADHISGLPGLLLTIGNSGREANEPLIIAGPKGLKRVVDSLRVIAPRLPFPIELVEMDAQLEDFYQFKDFSISATPADHEIFCLSYRFDLFRAAEFLPEAAKALDIPIKRWKDLQRGETVEHNGTTYYPHQVMGEDRPGLRLGYITDSRPTQNLVEFVEGSNLLICEGTYGDPADLPKAKENKHMTFAEAGLLGKAAGVEQLWLTHFSAAMPFPKQYYNEITQFFPGAKLGTDHLQTTLRFQD